ncbi:hypothetical protein BC940DRAFT_290832 [Gongronella butleri]|nr:hypothetical protein BC940DRAFT_290832 [Gongronella butleri]
MTVTSEQPDHTRFSVTTVCEVREDVLVPEATFEEKSAKADPLSDTRQPDGHDDPSLPPLDGKRGWLVVVGALCIQILAFGTASSWGT